MRGRRRVCAVGMVGERRRLHHELPGNASVQRSGRRLYREDAESDDAHEARVAGRLPGQGRRLPGISGVSRNVVPRFGFPRADASGLLVAGVRCSEQLHDERIRQRSHRRGLQLRAAVRGLINGQVSRRNQTPGGTSFPTSPID